MEPRRDDFSQGTIRNLANRAGNRCSNPNCRAPTSGPSDEPGSSISVGVAAHITAAAPGGPRYDAALTPVQRSGIDNAIWLCQTCSRLIDTDEASFRVEFLRGWKTTAELRAQKELGGTSRAVFEDLAEELVKRSQYAQLAQDCIPKGLPYESVRQRIEFAIQGRCEIVLQAERQLLVALAPARATLKEFIDEIRQLLLMLESVAPKAGVVELALIESDLWTGTDGGNCPIEWILIVFSDALPLLRGNSAEQTSFWNLAVDFLHFSQRQSGVPVVRQHNVGEALSLVHGEPKHDSGSSDAKLVDTNRSAIRLWGSSRTPVVVKPSRVSRHPVRNLIGFVGLASFEAEVQGSFPPTEKGDDVELWFADDKMCVRLFAGKIDYIQIRQIGTATQVTIDARDRGAILVDCPVLVECEADDIGELVRGLSPEPIRVVNGGPKIRAAIKSESLWKVLSILAIVFGHEFESRNEGFSFLPAMIRNKERQENVVHFGPDDILDISFQHGKRVTRRSNP